MLIAKYSYIDVATAEKVVLRVHWSVESESPHGRPHRRIQHHAMAAGQSDERGNKSKNCHATFTVHPGFPLGSELAYCASGCFIIYGSVV